MVFNFGLTTLVTVILPAQKRRMEEARKAREEKLRAEDEISLSADLEDELDRVFGRNDPL